MYFLNMKKGSGSVNGLFREILNPFYTFDTLDVGYLHNQVVNVFCMVNVDIYRSCEYPVFDREINIRHVYFQLGGNNICDLVYKAYPVNTGQVYPCQE